MDIGFQSHSDYVLATNILVNSMNQPDIFNDLISLFYEANKPLGKILLKDIKLSKKEIEIITDNNDSLCRALEKSPENKKLEHLVHSFCDVTVAVEHLKQTNI
jgi:hypothetical protein